MIITAPASTIRSAAKRAGYDKAIVIRTGLPAKQKEYGRFGGGYVAAGECTVHIAVLKPGVEEFVDQVAKRYGSRE